MSGVIVAVILLVVVAGTTAGAWLRSRSRNRDIDAP
jgi:hypothetical protein